jgi:hypothetical protein
MSKPYYHKNFATRSKAATTTTEPEPAPATESTAEPEPASGTEPAPATESTAEPTTEPEPAPEPAPATEPTTESTTEPEPAPATESTAEPTTEPEAAPATEPEPLLPPGLSLLTAVKLASLAYDSPEQVQANYEAKADMSYVTEPPIFCTDPDPVTDTQAYVISSNEEGYAPHIIVAARGSNSYADILEDLRAEMTPFKAMVNGQEEGLANNAWVHSGLFNQYIALEQLVTPHIYRLMEESPDAMLSCIGHSSGAGICCMLASVYSRLFPERVRFIGFGSPKIGDAQFRQFFQGGIPDKTQYQLIQNGDDIITKVMPGNVYVHVCDLTHIGEVDLMPEVPLMTDMTDHFISEYVRVIAAEEGETEPNLFQTLLRYVSSGIWSILHFRQ